MKSFFETYGYEISDGTKRDGFYSNGQALKFALSKCCDNTGNVRRDPNDLNKSVTCAIVKNIVELDVAEGVKKGFTPWERPTALVKTQGPGGKEVEALAPIPAPVRKHYIVKKDKDGLIQLVAK